MPQVQEMALPRTAKRAKTTQKERPTEAKGERGHPEKQAKAKDSKKERQKRHSCCENDWSTFTLNSILQNSWSSTK